MSIAHRLGCEDKPNREGIVMRTKIYEIPGKLNVEWEPDVKAIVDTWTTYFVTLEEFREAVLVQGVNYAKANGGQAWIIDSHSAKGVFSNEIHELIASDVLPTFAEIGIKYFMTIDAQDAVTRITVNQYTAQAGPHGMKILKGSSVPGAVEWLKKNG
jgi:hypothetical protein